MKWLRVWMKEEEYDGGKMLTGVVVGVSDDTWLMVRQDNGKVSTFNPSFILQSKWVSDPSKKVAMPKVVK